MLIIFSYCRQVRMRHLIKRVDEGLSAGAAALKDSLNGEKLEKIAENRRLACSLCFSQRVLDVIAYDCSYSIGLSAFFFAVTTVMMVMVIIFFLILS